MYQTEFWPVAAFLQRMGIVVLRKSVKLAITDWLVLIVSTHGPVPEQGPDQPAKAELLSGVAVRVTRVPDA